MKLEAALTLELVQAINDLSVEERAITFINVCNKLKDFFIFNWEEFPAEPDTEKQIKTFLIEVSNMQKIFSNFIQKGDCQ